jgi:hypothetical protein
MSSFYEAHRAATPPSLDGTLKSPCWHNAKRSASFVDMATGSPALYSTHSAVLWDDENLYVGFWAEEPYPTAHLTERDSIIFRENDLEVFIDGGDCYYEFEINALNTIYEVFFIWRDAYKKGGRFDIPEFDLFDSLSFAGDFDRQPESFWWGTHRRGARWAFLNWDFPGVRSAVHVEGKLNSTERALGWTAEIAFPWAGMKHLAGGRSLPPKDGDVWKMFLGRFQKIAIGPDEVQAAWCLTPHGKYDTHMPEMFTEIRFNES